MNKRSVGWIYVIILILLVGVGYIDCYQTFEFLMWDAKQFTPYVR